MSELPPDMQVAKAANQALLNNPRVNTGEIQLRPLTAPKARQCVEDWLREGIPLSVILGAVQRVCGAFLPSKENPRIGSFRYFEAAVHQDWEKSKGDVPLPDSLFAGLK